MRPWHHASTLSLPQCQQPHIKTNLLNTHCAFLCSALIAPAQHFQTARPQLMKPESQPYNGGEFQGDSTYKQTFVPKAVPYERFKPKHAAPPTGVSLGGFP